MRIAIVAAPLTPFTITLSRLHHHLSSLDPTYADTSRRDSAHFPPHLHLISPSLLRSSFAKRTSSGSPLLYLDSLGPASAGTWRYDSARLPRALISPSLLRSSRAFRPAGATEFVVRTEHVVCSLREYDCEVRSHPALLDSRLL
ncbi:hypothetical protein MSAN_00249400 [Mycena sanguinolenta]|uniref:Uncharacterized protein n=1 Tax=Mycena sanguinolenta TaxID=230812 RepID=A0A8H6ZJ29_9AGAR|nr:hypothetical protein MSAN_00249400 [Mycena sanguinolenta]